MLNITQGTLFILYLLFLWVPTKKALLLYQQNRYQMQRYDRSLNSYFETYQMQQIRLMGTTADAGITNVTEEQLVEISKSSLAIFMHPKRRK